ncbi:ead/Ea22-like family protein [Enterobacter hormaechei]|nr:ead/Ea22-like family protein [Enterobacter hormaechei]RUO05038.1 ead/Ea22-like family protein [Enterobacter hormaechei]
MSNIDKQALREIAAAAVGAHERLSVMPPDDIFDISLAEGTQLDADITALNALNSAANPSTVLALLDELEAAHELVELQRFKLERQAEDLHQAKSLESIHREKRFEVEREYSDYKHRAESNSMRLAKEVCLLEDALKAAGIRIEG